MIKLAGDNTLAERSPKKSAGEIVKELGCTTVADFFERISGHGSKTPGETDEEEGLIYAEDFSFKAFPEFPPRPWEQINRSRERQGSTFDNLRTYIAAYEATYRHHYEMQDDWLAIAKDPDLVEFAGVSSADRERFHSFGAPLPFELFERAMLSVADDDCLKSTLEWSGITWDVLYLHWIIEWRVRLGRFQPDIDGEWRAAVWRDTWRDVREEVAAINAKDYPDPRSVRERNVPAGDDYTADEAPSGGMLALARRIIEARELRPHPNKYADDRREKAKAVARELLGLAKGPWRDYIVQRSGRPLQLELLF